MIRYVLASAALAVAVASTASAQAIKNEPPVRHFSDEEIAAIAMPDLAFEETPEIVDDYEKYFYFHRDGTTFDQAYADVTECDALTSGLSYYAGGYPGYYPGQYGLGGVIGGAIGSLLADAIFGSAARRQQRRTNLRTCMYYKGYDRYGLAKDLWQEFNFEEGLSHEEADARQAALLQQALVASGPRPDQEVLAP